jgi:succinate-semialdehyde dehydrogenase/glutarate-semialdehyde dehydrogenase
VQDSVYEQFVEKFVNLARALKVGNGADRQTTMGPLANNRRITAVEDLVADALQKGAILRTGGRRLGNKGYFYEPTVLTNVSLDARVMNEEPFGPIATIAPFHDLDDLIAEANRLPYGLASYAFTRSNEIINTLSTRVEVGMMTINHLGLALPEAPFGGVKDSGCGSEGGTEAIESYLNTKFVTAL